MFQGEWMKEGGGGGEGGRVKAFHFENTERYYTFFLLKTFEGFVREK